MKKRIVVFIAAVIMLNGCTANELQSVPVSLTDLAAQTTAVTTTSAPETTTAPTETEPPETTPEPVPDSLVNLVFAGDNLIHTPIYNQANRRADGEGYSFTEAYTLVKPYIERADYAVLNQETLVNSLYEPSTYPFFSSPTELGDQMIELGFDAFSIANNHVFDKGADAFFNSMDYWATKTTPVYGAYRDEEDLDNIRTAEVNGITMAFVGCMEHTNGLPVPAGSGIKALYLSNEELIEKQIRAADELADVVIVSVHFGIEVINDVTEQQREFAQKFADWGADLIIGTQPHTIQTMEFLEKSDGGQAFVFYCLGNFISAMSRPCSMVEMLGDVTLKKSGESGEITIEKVKAIPLINQYESSYSNIRIIPFAKYTEQDGINHGVREFGTFSKDYAENLIRENIPEEFLSIE